IAAFLGFMFFVSSAEVALTHSSALALRLLLERNEQQLPSLLPLVLEDRMQVQVPLNLGTQISLITIAILSTHLSIERWPEWGVAYAFVIIFLISLVFRQLLPRLLTQNNHAQKLVLLLPAFQPVYRMLRSLPLPLSRLLRP